MQHKPEGIGIVPLVKGRVDSRFLSAVDVALKQVLSGMGHVEKRWLLLRKNYRRKARGETPAIGYGGIP